MCGADWTEQNKFLKTFPNLSNSAFSNCSKNVQNVIQMELKWLFVFRKIARIAQWLGTLPPDPYLSNLVFSNCSKNV